MTLTTAQAFDAFVSKINLTETQKAEVQSKRSKTEEYLRDAFTASSTLPVKRVILIGSTDRGTLIRPLDDIDVMVEFTNKDNIFETYRRKSDDFLQRIRTGLQAKTSVSQIGARGQAVRLFYTNGAHVDIAPVFKWKGNGFALPSGDGGWITTDPEKQASWMAERRTKLGQNLTPIVKIAKRWNGVHSGRLSSYHCEVMVASMFSALSGDWRTAMKCVFEWGQKYLDVTDPAGHAGKLSNYLTPAARQAATSRFNEATQRADNALAAESSGNHAEAKRLWRIELGDEFPIG
jgi:predicted nucleotidyltransferase